MNWNITAECISVVFLLIIWMYSRKGNLVPSLKNRMFQACFMLTFFSMVFNILSTILIAYPNLVPVFVNQIITTLYFASTPLMGMAYCFYTITIVFEQKKVLKIMAWFLIPAILYMILVLINPFTDVLFDLDGEGIYTQGPLILTTYIVFYFYCLSALIVTLFRYRSIEPTIRKILMVFPAIALTVIVIQQIYPVVILSGSAATSALLIIYLYFQNKQNSTDYLTNLSNRQEFLKMIDLKIKKSQSFFITVISLRGFRRINDTYGQHFGDLFLQAIKDYLILKVSPRNLFRYSGDEFAILSYDLEEQNRIVTDVEARMAQPWQGGQYQCVIPAAIGIVHYPKSAVTVEELVNGIEYAVFRSKEIGKIYACGQEMLADIKRRDQILNILEKNLEDDSFTIYFQPVYSIATGKYTAAEALLRIPESPIGALYPDEFIPIAEESGLIIPMTYQVLNKACQILNRLEEEGISLEGIQVNFSSLQFSQIDLEERVVEIMEQNHTPFSKIKIEITESVLADKLDVVEQFIFNMHKRGVLVELDDFGTGYSNLVTVMNLPLDIVKFDKGLIWSSVTKPQSAAMLKSLTEIFHKMKMQVLAEGVETTEQEQLVRHCNIDYIQGYFYSKPLPENQLIDFLRKNGGKN